MPALHQSDLHTVKGRTFYGVLLTVLTLGIPLQIFPYVWMVTNMFKTNAEVMKLPPTLLPTHWLWGNIGETFRQFSLWIPIKNTFLLVIGTILIQVTISTLAAFSLSKLKPNGARLLLLFFVGTLMINQQALALPTYVMMTDFFGANLIDNLWSLLFAFSAWGWVIFLLKGFFDGLPSDLMESATIDGAGSLTILTRIVLPLSKPVFAVVLINTFMAVYNQFLFPLILLPSQENWTIMIRIFAAQQGSIKWNQVMVLLTLSTIPVLLAYIFAQKYIVQGISMTGLKG